MAHTWLKRFGLQRVTDGMGIDRYREAGLRTAGLSEVFVPVGNAPWAVTCIRAMDYTRDMCHARGHADVSDTIKELIGPGQCGSPFDYTIAVQVGRVASLLAWNGLQACSDPGVFGQVPDFFGSQHSSWVLGE